MSSRNDFNEDMDAFWKKILGDDNRPHLDSEFQTEYNGGNYHGEGIEDMSFIVKTGITCCILFIFLAILALVPINKDVQPIFITEKSTSVVDSISEFDIEAEPDLLAQMLKEKKQRIAEVNKEINKINEKKALADTLKAKKKELLTLSAMVDDGFTTREITAEAEVDSITNETIDMLSQSLQVTVDSIAMQARLKTFIELQNSPGSISRFSGSLSMRELSSRKISELLGI